MQAELQHLSLRLQPGITSLAAAPSKGHVKGMGTGITRMFLVTAFPISNDLPLRGFQRQ